MVKPMMIQANPPEDILKALPPDLQDMAASIATHTGVTVADVLIEAARDGLTAIKPRWEFKQRGESNGIP